MARVLYLVSNFILLFQLLVVPSAHALDIEGCMAFKDLNTAYSFYRVNKEAGSYPSMVPVMVNYAAGMSGQEDFKWGHLFGVDKLKYYDEFITEAKDIQFERALKQMVEVHYLIAPYLSPTGYYFDHHVERLPEVIAPLFCKKDCTNEERQMIEQKVKVKIENLQRLGYPQYDINELSESLSYLVSSLNNKYYRASNEDIWELYKNYIKDYYQLFQGLFGNFFLSINFRKLIGGPLNFDDFKKKKSRRLHNDKITRYHVEEGFKEMTYMMNQSWGLKKHPMLQLDKKSFFGEDFEQSLEKRLMIIKNLVVMSPDVIVQVFKNKPKFQKDLCFIFNEIDTALIHQETDNTDTRFNLFFAPIAVGLIALPLILGTGPIGAGAVVLLALNGVTAIDLAFKFKKGSDQAYDMNQNRSVLYASKKERASMNAFFNQEKRYKQHSKTIMTVFAMELVGLGITTKIYKAGQKIYKRLSRSEIESLVLSRVQRNGRKLLKGYRPVMGSPTQAEYIASLSEKQLNDLFIKTNALYTSKMMITSEGGTEAIKQTYLLIDGLAYGSVLPGKALFQALSGDRDNLKAQRQLEWMMENN